MMRRRRDRGFTLVELLVVIVLIGLFATTVTVAVIPAIKRGKKTKAMNDMVELKKAIQFYYMDHSNYPDTLQELTQASGDYPNGYVESVPDDPWGEEYVYDGQTATANSEYTLFSKGPDQIEGTEDDIILGEKLEDE